METIAIENQRLLQKLQSISRSSGPVSPEVAVQNEEVPFHQKTLNFPRRKKEYERISAENSVCMLAFIVMAFDCSGIAHHEAYRKFEASAEDKHWHGTNMDP